MQIDLWTLALQTINALVLIWLLQHFLFRPIASMINTRQAAANQMLDEAQQIRAVAERDQESVQRQLTELAQERNAALDASTAEAAALKDTLLKNARLEAAGVVKESKKELTQLQHQINNANCKQATALALDIANKLLTRLPETSRVTGFIDGLVEAIAALPKNERISLANDNATLQLTAASTLTEPEIRLCQNAVTDALGSDVHLEIHTDTALIAGLELSGAHFSVQNSFRADLERLGSALATNEHQTT